MNNRLPILNAYIYRNLLIAISTLHSSFLTISQANNVLRKLVHTAPAIVYCEIFKELECYGLVRKIKSPKGFQIISDSRYIKQLRRLREYAFPINPQ